MATTGYSKADVQGWANGGGGGGDPGAGDGAADPGAETAGAGGADEGDEDEEPDAEAKDCCDILKKFSGELDEGLKALKGYTLPDDTAKAFKKKYSKLQDAIEELKSEVDDLADEHEEDHEEPEEEEDDDDADADDGDGGGGADDESDD